MGTIADSPPRPDRGGDPPAVVVAIRGERFTLRPGDTLDYLGEFRITITWGPVGGEFRHIGGVE